MNKAYLFLAYGAIFALSLLDNGRGPAYPSILKDFHLETSKGALIFSLASFSGLVLNFTSRYWLGFLGPIKATRYSLALLGMSGILYWYSGQSHQFPLLILASILLGVGLAICTITMNILVASGSDEKNRRKLFAGLHSVYGATSFAAPFILTFFVSNSLTWKEYFLVVSIAAFIVLIISFFLGGLKKIKVNKSPLKKSVSLGERFLFGVMLASYVSAEILISSRLPYVLEKAYHFTPNQAAISISCFFALLGMGRLSFSFINLRYSSGSILTFSLITSLVSFLLGFFITPYFYILIGLFQSYFFPVAMNYLSEIYQERSEYMTTAVMTFIGVGLSLTHYIFGISNEFVGTKISFALVFLLFSLSLTLLIKINRQLARFSSSSSESL